MMIGTYKSGISSTNNYGRSFCDAQYFSSPESNTEDKAYQSKHKFVVLRSVVRFAGRLRVELDGSYDADLRNPFWVVIFSNLNLGILNFKFQILKI